MEQLTGAAQPGARLDTKIIHSLDKGMYVLELIGAGEGHATLAGLTEKLQWDKSTVFRLIATLIRRGYVEQDPINKHLRLGYRVLHLNELLLRSLNIAQLSRDLLVDLADATRETSHIGALQSDHGIIIAQRDSPEKVGVYAHVGEIEPLHCTALGKALLMQMSDGLLTKTIARLELVKHTPNTITSQSWLLETVQKVRVAGYVVDDEEYVTGARCIAAPIKVPGSSQLLAIGISGPAWRIVAGRVPSLVAEVMNAAKEFNRKFEANDSFPPMRRARAGAGNPPQS